jgi:hypothetical protein
MEKCSIENCENQEIAPMFWNGKRYCVEHYNKFIWEEFFSHYNNWVTGEPAPEKFKYILGRACEEDYFEDIGDSFLSKARIHVRGFNYIKTEKGCTFEITRHLNAWEGIGKRKNVVEKWEIDIEKRTFKMVAKRKFRKGDYD